MQTYKPTLGSNEVQYFMGGNSFHLIQASYGITVEYLKADLTNINQTASDVESGYTVSYKEGFDLVKVTNGSTAQTVKFGIARGGKGGYNISSSNITGGTIDEIVSQNRSANLANHYMGECNMTALAGNYTYCGLYNPAGSGVVVGVSSVVASQSVIGNLGLYVVQGNGGSALLRKGYNKKFSGSPASDSLSEMRRRQNTATIGGYVYSNNVHSNVPADEPRELIKQDAIILPENTFLYASSAINSTLRVGMEWEEF